MYQDLKVSAERKRKAPLRSTTRRPASTKRGRNFRGNFMRRGEKRGSGAALRDGIDRERAQRRFAESAKLGKQFGEALRAMGFANVEDRVVTSGWRKRMRASSKPV